MTIGWAITDLNMASCIYASVYDLRVYQIRIVFSTRAAACSFAKLIPSLSIA